MICNKTTYLKSQGKVEFQSPSNIAMVKYWGKKEIQIPENPSISFSLKNALTQTSIEYQFCENQNAFDIQFLFEGKENPSFLKKLHTFFNRISETLHWLIHFQLKINSDNTFPHSSGIASSASSYASLALCLAQIHHEVSGEILSNEKVSNIARLGSGSACRSIFGGWNTWGKSNFPNSDDHYAISLNNNIHSDFSNIQDSILIVSADKKAISSTVGHQLMESHPYKEGRIIQATDNTHRLIEILEKGNWNDFIKIVESEALSLHGLMMSSTPGYTLLLPESLSIVQQIREFREQNNIPVCFTIDAGPNIHVLYPASNKKEVQEFIDRKLKAYCFNNTVIHDEIGPGPCEIQ